MAMNEQVGQINTAAAARILSDIANPLIIPLVIFISVAFMFPYAPMERVWLIMSSALWFTILPLVAVFQLVQKTASTDRDFSLRTSRIDLYGYSFAGYLSGTIFLLMQFDELVVVISAFVLLFNIIFGFLLNFKWKVSVHSGCIALGGTLLLLFFSFSLVDTLWAALLGIFLVVVLLPTVIWARYTLGIHSMGELIAGTATGVLGTLVVTGCCLAILS